ncbi:ATPase stabilizing factor 15 kDa protein [Scheffersomyces spartinae]|uniref:ATPase stabilizing factor 15 kDa protein n=1 Tax=Scheffersomyces spartinae TaxID=45513 RepID=A0A9P7VAQ6_9ASCO|nr:ATPase stabilizing factor 15 kDa protein [Scheffersomyces spartinae]KAG7194513.1 ATPase stabilizing factor 15 kDa protein [Scheffersomyces spartinae]
MSRTNKWTVHESKSEPKWFTHNGHSNTDPTKTKKEGAGNHNWGRPGDEIDVDDLLYNKSQRRNSNHQEHEDMMDRVETEVDAKLLN